MSKFFEQYNAVLEKNLQKVRLKVDPLNKYAEDYGQYDGYVGYILAETENEIKFFYNNRTLNIPKKAVVIEATNFLQGLAGQSPVGKSGAVGSIIRDVAGTAARAVFGPGVTGTPTAPGSDTNNSTPTTSNDGLPMVSQDMLGKSFAVVDSKGTASFTGSSNKTFYILKIQLLNKTKNVLENKSFRDIANFYTYLFESNGVPPQPQQPQPQQPQPQQPQPQQPQPQQPQPQQPQPQQPQPPAPTTNTPPTSAAPLPQKSGIRFIDITSKPEFLNENALFTCMNIKDNSLVQGYGLLTRVPNSNDFVINFSAQQS